MRHADLTKLARLLAPTAVAALCVGCPDTNMPVITIPWPNANTIGFAAADVRVVANGGGGMLWENGSVTSLLSGRSTQFIAASVFVSNGDVYVAGHEVEGRNMESLYAAAWKNGSVIRIGDADTRTEAQSVFVANGKLHAAGRMLGKDPEWRRGAMLWVDGEATLLSDTSGTGSYACANSVFVSNGHVYAAGEDAGSATLWVDGSATRLPDGVVANFVCVSGQDVYVAGRAFNLGYDAVLWVNGERTLLGSGGAAANSVAVSGGDVYVAGMHGGGPALWKNGVEQPLENPEHSVGRANSVAVSGGDVYVVGEMGHLPILWKNGKAHWIEWPQKDTTPRPLSISVTAK